MVENQCKDINIQDHPSKKKCKDKQDDPHKKKCKNNKKAVDINSNIKNYINNHSNKFSPILPISESDSLIIQNINSCTTTTNSSSINDHHEQEEKDSSLNEYNSPLLPKTL
eukprot:545605_1